MDMNELYEQFVRELTTYFYSLGFFSGMHMIVIVSALIYNQYLNFAVYLTGVVLNSLLNQYIKPIVGDARPKNPLKYLASEKFVSKNEVYGLPSGHSQNVFFSIVYLYYTIHYFMPWTMIGLLLAGATIYERWAFHNHSLIQLFSGAVVGGAFAYFVVYVRDVYLSKYVHY